MIKKVLQFGKKQLILCNDNAILIVMIKGGRLDEKRNV